jgi:DNA-binding transcriptional regulator LsrR (DeoR family)
MKESCRGVRELSAAVYATVFLYEAEDQSVVGELLRGYFDADGMVCVCVYVWR